ncbi:MAG: glycine betaine/proline transport system substrate-binding protein [Rubrobacteraceae bacterium]|nr:glycine betaine/proline transport system substrate-binding protein [Rubrobacteraceae bacterium]
MGRGGRYVKAVLLGLLLVVSLLAFGACGGGASSDDTVNFGTVDWPEAIAKTNVSATIAQGLGYKTEIQELGVPTVFKGLEQGDLDVFVEAWFPTMQTNFDAVNQDDVKSVTTNLSDATFSIAVNKEACDAGVRSHEDLNKFADRFAEGGTPTIYGLEPGNDGNQVVLDMIKNDTYNLGDWKLVESSTNGMLSEVDRRLGNGEWVAWTGWEPHWMNNKYDMCLLDDPEQAWGGPSHVETLVNANFPEKFPELYTFFEQMKVTKAIQADLIDRIDNSGKEPKQAALDWLRENPDVTDQWLEGVTATDGTDGAEALRNYLEKQS